MYVDVRQVSVSGSEDVWLSFRCHLVLCNEHAVMSLRLSYLMQCLSGKEEGEVRDTDETHLERMGQD